MPALVAGIHDLEPRRNQDVDGRDKPGHDGAERPQSNFLTSSLRSAQIRE